jgi:hypothetical protein
MIDDTNPLTNQSAPIPQVSPKEVLIPSVKTKVRLSREALTGRNLKLLTDYAENGLTYDELALKYNMTHGNVFHIVSKYSKLYSPGVTHNKIKRMSFLNRKHRQNEVADTPADPIDVIKELRAEYEPKQANMTLIDKQITINATDLDNLSMEERVERVRRALAGD